MVETVTILVGTTLCRFAMEQPEIWGAWLHNAEAMRASDDRSIEFFAAIELDGEGLTPFKPLLERLADLNETTDRPYFTYTLDDGRAEVTTHNRVRHITMGQNLVTDHACANPRITHMLFMAADCEPPRDAIPKLLEMNWPIVGGHIPLYGLTGPVVESYTDYPVREQMASAAFIMLNRDLFRQLRWRWDLDACMTDDPCMHYDALTLLNTPTYVRYDVVGRHYPDDYLPGIEYRGYDLTVTPTS